MGGRKNLDALRKFKAGLKRLGEKDLDVFIETQKTLLPLLPELDYVIRYAEKIKEKGAEYTDDENE
jgi:hypothetical protein